MDFFYKASINKIWLKLSKIQELDPKTWKIREKGLKDMKKLIEYCNTSYYCLYSKSIKLKFLVGTIIIFLAKNFDINKFKELMSQKYHWLNLEKNIKTYIKNYNVYFDLKTVKHKFYNSF